MPLSVIAIPGAARLSRSADHGAAAKWLVTMGMCLMNGYAVVKGHAHSPYREGNRRRAFVPSACFLTQTPNV